MFLEIRDPDEIRATIIDLRAVVSAQIFGTATMQLRSTLDIWTIDLGQSISIFSVTLERDDGQLRTKAFALLPKVKIGNGDDSMSVPTALSVILGVIENEKK